MIFWYVELYVIIYQLLLLHSESQSLQGVVDMVTQSTLLSTPSECSHEAHSLHYLNDNIRIALW